MALAYLLDEHISDVVSQQIRAKRRDIQINSIRFWREGAFQGMPDKWLLRAAAEDGLTLVTYDRKTIPPLLTEWGATGEQHGGVLFVDEKTIREGDIGGMVNALIEHWNLTKGWDWSNAIDFLRAAPGT